MLMNRFYFQLEPLLILLVYLLPSIQQLLFLTPPRFLPKSFFHQFFSPPLNSLIAWQSTLNPITIACPSFQELGHPLVKLCLCILILVILLSFHSFGLQRRIIGVVHKANISSEMR